MRLSCLEWSCAQRSDHLFGRDIPSDVRSSTEGPWVPPARRRPSSWRTFQRAHWGGIAGADFFTTEVWTARGLVTYYTVCTGPREPASAGDGVHAQSRYPIHGAGRATSQDRKSTRLNSSHLG